MAAMDLLEELARNNVDPALIARVRVEREQAQRMAAEKDFKIAALTHELAYYRRIRFGKTSEVLSGEQRLLFEETVDVDLSAIEAELESAHGKGAGKRKRAGRQVLPPELPRIEHRHEPASCQCGACGRDLVRSAKTSASGSTWNRRASSCIATSARSMPAASARP
jgi:hypothetical protein